MDTTIFNSKNRALLSSEEISHYATDFEKQILTRCAKLREETRAIIAHSEALLSRVKLNSYSYGR